MRVVTILEWKYSPPDYFEASIQIARDEYVLTIADGKAEATIPDEFYMANPSIRERIDASLHDRFLGVQLLTHKPFELSKSVRFRLHPDGRKDAFLEVASARMSLVSGAVDFQVTDRSGTVIVDTKKERIKQKQTIADLVATHRPNNPVLASLLRSYDAAVRDPDNELVHLYEIREAVSQRFGNEGIARRKLGITRTQWSRLGQLANDEPLKQGRHRGRSVTALRDATEAELAEARTLGRAIINAYLFQLAEEEGRDDR